MATDRPVAPNLRLRCGADHRRDKGAGPTGILRRHDLHCVVSSVRLPGIYDKLCSGETLPCSLVGLQLKAHEPAW